MAASPGVRLLGALVVAFNGYQSIATALVRSGVDADPRLPPSLPPRVRALVAHLVLLDHGAFRTLEGGIPPASLEAWVRGETARLPAERDAFVVRHRVEDGRGLTPALPRPGEDRLSGPAHPRPASTDHPTPPPGSPFSALPPDGHRHMNTH